MILNRVLEATEKVVAGQAAFERDGVAFDEIELPHQLLSPMLHAAARAGGVLSVLDFGGSLGSKYHQCRAFLEGIELRWSVVEQPDFVRIGQARFQNDELRFYMDPAEAAVAGEPNVVLFSSVLQYLERPFETLRGTLRSSVDCVVIDRTPVTHGPTCVCVQHVPRNIYPGSYPMWIFDGTQLLAEIGSEWHMVSSELSPEGRWRLHRGPAFEFRGMVFRRGRD